MTNRKRKERSYTGCTRAEHGVHGEREECGDDLSPAGHGMPCPYEKKKEQRRKAAAT
jgi:hypothetical protein